MVFTINIFMKLMKRQCIIIEKRIMLSIQKTCEMLRSLLKSINYKQYKRTYINRKKHNY